MAKALYISATGENSGKLAIALGTMRLLLGRIRKVAFFRPIIQDNAETDHEINLISDYFGLNLAKENCYACTREQAHRYINSGQTDDLMNVILEAYNKLKEEYEFVLCQGTDFFGKNSAFETDLNADIAATLGAPVLLVQPAYKLSTEELQLNASNAVEVFSQRGIEVISLILNRCSFDDLTMESIYDELEKVFAAKFDTPPLLYHIPNDPILTSPSMRDVAMNLNATVIYGEDNLINHHVNDYLVAAMHIGNFLNFVQEGNLIITPGDREDILLGSIAASTSRAYPTLSGILLTGGISMSPSIKRLFDGMSKMPVPVLSVKTNTTETISAIINIRDRIESDDIRKVHTALGSFERHVSLDQLITRMVETSSSRMTPRMFEYTLTEQARKYAMRIVLPEGKEERILRAAEALRSRAIAKLILLGDEEIIADKAKSLGISLHDIIVIDPKNSPKLEEYAATYMELRKKKGISLDEARDRMLDPTYYGTMMVYMDDADGLVSGSINTTANTVRPALEFIKTKPGFSIVSSVFLMCLKDRVLAFGDCAINPDPTAEQLADIAITAADTAKIFGIEPKVAMLSYSTGSSGKGEDVDKVKEATNIAKSRAPELLLEGPLQYDAAIDPDVAKTKMPNNPVAGQATVFVFPDLNTGNNTYKAVQRAADAIAIGPILQGLKRPVNDLSRGCTVHDIINTVAITAIQAQAEKGLK